MRKLAVVVAAAVLATGCTAARRNAVIEEEVSKYTYEKPLGEVMPHAKVLLKELGFSYRETSEPPMIITEWREDMASSDVAATRYRYLVEGFRLRLGDGKEGSQVRITKHLIDARGSPDASAQQKLEGGRDSIGGLPDEGNRPGTAGDGPPNEATKSVPYSQRATLDDAAGVQAGGPSSTKRDLQFEWRLLQRVSPIDAKRLEAYTAEVVP